MDDEARNDGPIPNAWASVHIDPKLVQNLEALWPDRAVDPCMWKPEVAARRYGKIQLTNWLKSLLERQEARRAGNTADGTVLSSDINLGPRLPHPTMFERTRALRRDLPEQPGLGMSQDYDGLMVARSQED